MVAAAWWLGKINVSAMTTFSLLPAANTIVSAISSGVNGSHPLSRRVSIIHTSREGIGDSRIDGIGLALVTVEPDDRELRLDLTGIDANHPNSLGDEFLAQALGEGSDGTLGRAVDGTTNVGLPAGNGADVDDVAGPFAVVPRQHAGEDGLCHVDQACHVGCEHDGDIILLNLWCLGHTLDQAAVPFVSSVSRSSFLFCKPQDL